MLDVYRDFKVLAANEEEGKDYRVQVMARGTPAAVVAPHGGQIEPGTSAIASAIAGEDLSLYLFEGISKRRVEGRGNGRLHITSTRFHEDRADQLVRSAQVIIGVHGRANQRKGMAKPDPETVWVGGLEIALRARIADQLTEAGFKATADLNDLMGKEPDNICNRGHSGKGVQLEIPRGLRDDLVKSAEQMEIFAIAVRQSLQQHPYSVDVSNRIEGIAGAYAIGFEKTGETGSEIDLNRIGPAGSGTLVEICGIRGVLTAAHVVKELHKLPRVGIVRFGRDIVQRLAFDSSAAEYVCLGDEPWLSDGPDLAFIRLPYAVEEELAASNSFWNLSARLRQIESGGSSPSRKIAHMIAGVVAEDSKVRRNDGENTVVSAHNMHLMLGTISNYRKSNAGFDLVDFATDPRPDKNAPKSYQGVSGGGLWQFGVSATSDEPAGPKDTKIAGVAFHELLQPDGTMKIICHGPETIFEHLARLVAERWNKRWPEDA